MASFVSADELDAKRQQRKEQRRAYHEEILKETKEKFFRQRRQQELRKERGDDKWVAPGISSRLGLPEAKKKKKKKHQKEKRHHKGKRQAESRESDDGDSSNDSEGVWVEQGTSGSSATCTPATELEQESDSTVTPATLERDSWMMMPPPPSMAAQSRLSELAEVIATSRTKRDRDSEEAQLQCFDKPGQHPKELNPYWKDGGRGLPSQEKGVHKEEEEGSRRSSTKVGDGGRSWMLRAYKRALERAEEEGRSIDEVATERWGSLEKLHSLLEQAGIDPQDPDRRPARGRRDYLYSRFSHDSNREEERRSHRRRFPDRERGKDYASEERGSAQTDFSSIAFMKPGEETRSVLHRPASDSKGWQKKPSASDQAPRKPPSPPPSLLPPHLLTGGSEHDTSTSHAGPSCSAQPPAPSSNPVSDSQINSIAAKLMKAEIMGDVGKIERLKKQLEELRQQQQQMQEKRGNMVDDKRKHEEEVILLTKTDRFGRTRPVDLTHGKPSSYPTKAKGSSTHTEKGKRRKYFADDDQYSLRALVEQERMVTAEETHAAIARMATKFVPAANTDDTVDDVVDSKIATRYNPEKESERQRQRAIVENRKMTEILENCRLCFDNANFEKHLLIAVGLSVYLAVPSCQSLTDGHCLLVPMEHAVCSMLLDENVWSEIGIFRKGLTAMFAERGMDVIFMETYSSTRGKNHMCIECIPLPKEIGELAPMYFKKAILESDEEWSDNRKVIDTSKKGVRGSVPTGLPYFFVEFGTDGGFAHIIENQDKFPRYFGKEVCGGMLDVEPRLWLKPPREGFEQQKQKVLGLSEWWRPYDWTQKLKERQD